MALPEVSGGRARRSTKRLRWLAALFGAAALVFLCAAPASAHVRVFIGGVFGVPVYSYPYAYPYPYSPYPYYAPPPVVVYPGVPPGAWIGGHWSWRHGPWGHRVRVWVPAHLR